MMDTSNTLLLVIDLQGKLASSVYEHELLFGNLERMIKIAQIFKLPILWTEQAPDKIGPTVEPIAALLFPLVKPIAKRSFSCYGSEEFRREIKAIGRQHVLIIGIETHVCIYQSARDLSR